VSNKHDREQSGSAGKDDAVARAWRQASDEQPPARLDAEILAAARQSIQEAHAGAKTLPNRPRARSRWMQWQPLAAAATVAGLAFVLVQTLPRESEVAAPVRMEAPESVPAPPSAQAPTPTPDAELELRSDAPALAVTATPASPGVGPAERDRGTESAARSPAADVAAGIADSMGGAETDRRKGLMTEASGEGSSAEASARALARAPGALTAPSASDWTARIKALHAAGDLAGAATALREFRKVDPDADAQLPESLQEWAWTVE
jgi:hypothetical protein